MKREVENDKATTKIGPASVSSSLHPSPFTLSAVLFDLDGTLVDTAPDLGGAANHIRASLHLPPLPLEQYRPAASAGARGLLKLALGISHEHPDFPRHREDFLNHYGENLARHSRLFPGMAETLTALEQRGVVWGVVTNKPKRYTDPLMAQLNLQAACTVSADEVANGKPAPDSLFEACRRLNLESRACIYVGDDKRDIDAGRAAGMKTVAAGWGYEGEHPISTWGADVTAATPSALLSLLD